MLKLRLKYENYQGWRCEVFTAHWWFVCSCVVGRLTARFCLGVSRCQAALWLGNPPPSLLLSSVFTVRGLQRARKGPWLARSEGAYVGQLWFLPPLHHLDHSLKPCPGQPGLSRRTQWPELVRLKLGNKTPLVTASTESWWGNSQQDRMVWEVSGVGTLFIEQVKTDKWKVRAVWCEHVNLVFSQRKGTQTVFLWSINFPLKLAGCPSQQHHTQCQKISLHPHTWAV